MRRTLVCAVVALWIIDVTASELPRFEQFPTKVEAVHAPAAVQIKSRDARTFRTVLREGAKAGPNFAGHYTVVTWGCGTACQRLAIVDALTGEVFFPPQLQPNSYSMVTDGSEPFEYRLESALLIVTGAPMDKEDAGTFYYHWTGKSLKQLRYVRKEWQR